MSGFDIRDFIQAASAAVTDGGPARAPRRKLRTPTAEGVVDVDVRPSYSPVVLEGAVRLTEFMIVAGLGVLVHHVYLSEVVPFDLPYATAVIGLAALTVLVFQAAGAYAVSAFRAFFLFGLRIIAAWSLVVLIALTVVFFAKIGDNFSRVWLASLYFLGAGAAGSLAARAVPFSYRQWTRAGRLDRRTAIVGGGDCGRGADPGARRRSARRDIRIVGVFDDRDDDRSPDVVAGYPKLGTVDDLVEFARRTRSISSSSRCRSRPRARILQMLKQALGAAGRHPALGAYRASCGFRPRAYSYIGKVPVLDVFDKPIADWDVVIKWLFDKVVGSARCWSCCRRSCSLTAIADQARQPRARCSSGRSATASTTS